jgi:hypothetical protein
MKRLPYSATVIAAAVSMARKTIQQRGVRLVCRRGVQTIVRTIGNEALPIAANQMGRWS